MPDSEEPATLAELDLAAWPADVRDLVDAVVDVARRLGQNVLADEHLLIVGAEHGVESMARVVGSLAAFREALLDRLFESRDEFVRTGDGAEQQLFVTPDLQATLERLKGGQQPEAVLIDLMQSTRPRIRAAVAHAREVEPDIVPPDTLALDAEATRASLTEATGAATAAASASSPQASSASRTRSAGRSAGVVPLTIDLCADAAEDLPLIGRQQLLDQLVRILLRFHEPAVLLAGQPGSGKTALLRGMARAACTGGLPALSGLSFHQLRILDLVSQSHRGQDVHALLDQLCHKLAAEPGAVLVVDDLHQLVAKQGYPMLSDLLDTLKLHLKRGKLRALLSVEASEFERHFASDPFFATELTVRPVPLLEGPALAQILRGLRGRLEAHFHLRVTDEALDTAVARSLAESDAEYVPPGSTIRLLDEACAMARARGEEQVLAQHVASTADEETPAAIAQWDRERLANLEQALGQHVLGQSLAAAAVARRVRLSKLHLDRKPERPDGVFLFIGPSGVGKTELARALARALYDDESRLVRIDMSEYMEPHSVARIIGSPPGYVGFGEEGALTGPVMRIGHGVVLLDEIEKAHPQVLNLFLQVFDDGRLTDSKGRVVDFSETVIIMTSNIGRDLYALGADRPIGFGAGGRTSDGPVRDAVQEHLLRVLPPEFVNRIDEVVPFRVLLPDDMLAIARRMLETETQRWLARGKQLVYDEEVVTALAQADYDPRLGARHLERNLERLVITMIGDAAVSPGFEQVRELALKVERGAICLSLDGEPYVCPPRPAELQLPAAPEARVSGARGGKPRRSP